MGIMRTLDIQACTSLVGATSNTAGAIFRTRETLLVTGLLVGARRFGRASGALADNVVLIDGVLIVGL